VLCRVLYIVVYFPMFSCLSSVQSFLYIYGSTWSEIKFYVFACFVRPQHTVVNSFKILAIFRTPCHPEATRRTGRSSCMSPVAVDPDRSGHWRHSTPRRPNVPRPRALIVPPFSSATSFPGGRRQSDALSAVRRLCIGSRDEWTRRQLLFRLPFGGPGSG